MTINEPTDEPQTDEPEGPPPPELADVPLNEAVDQRLAETNENMDSHSAGFGAALKWVQDHLRWNAKKSNQTEAPDSAPTEPPVSDPTPPTETPQD